MNRSILLAVDGAAGSEMAVRLLEGYRGAAGATSVAALNVQVRPIAIWPEANVDVAAMESALLEEGRAIAEPAAARLRAIGMRAQAAVRLGLPSEMIVREARSCAADLVVVGTRGHGAVHGFALGSVAMRVAHGSDSPVCLVRPDALLPARLGESIRVMLALDGSAPATRAARLLVAWRDWIGKPDVHIVHVQQPLTYLAMILPPHDDVMQQWSTAAGEAATRDARELFAKEGVDAHLHLTVGDAATEIFHLASEQKCELIVLGTRGLGAAHHALIGSVALKVAARAEVPVIFVK